MPKHANSAIISAFLEDDTQEVFVKDAKSKICLYAMLNIDYCV